jgi:hypothetical protein
VTSGRLAEENVADAPDVPAARTRGDVRGLLPAAAGLVTALSLAWYFTGPP